MILLEARTTNTASDDPGHVWKANGNDAVTFQVDGNFDGATAKLQRQRRPGAPWVDVPNASFSAAGMVLGLRLSPGYLRVNVASAGAGTSITAEIG